MSGPLFSSAQEQIRKVDTALNHFIQKTQSGKNDMADLFGIEQQLLALSKNPNIPDQVRQNLLSALKELKQIQSGGVNLANLYTAKIQLDNAAHAVSGEAEGTKKTEGGEL